MKQSYLSTGPALFDATATSTTFAHDTRPTEHRLIISPKKFQPTSPSSQSLLQAIKSNQCQHSSLQQPQARAPQHQLTPPPPRQYPRFDFGPMTRPAPSTAAAAPGSKSLKSGQGRRKPDAPPSVARARQPRQVTSEPPERERRQEAEWDQTRDLISSIMNVSPFFAADVFCCLPWTSAPLLTMLWALHRTRTALLKKIHLPARRRCSPN